VKKQAWGVYGHKAGTSQRNRRLGSIFHRAGATREEAMKMARKDFLNHTITDVR